MVGSLGSAGGVCVERPMKVRTGVVLRFCVTGNKTGNRVGVFTGNKIVLFSGRIEDTALRHRSELTIFHAQRTQSTSSPLIRRQKHTYRPCRHYASTGE